VLAAGICGSISRRRGLKPGEAIYLRSAVTGRERVIPIDAQNRFHIDWSVTHTDSRLTRESFHSLLDQDQRPPSRPAGSGEYDGEANWW